MRKQLTIILSILLLAGAAFISKRLIDNKNKPKPKFDKIIKTVFVNEVRNNGNSNCHYHKRNVNRQK